MLHYIYVCEVEGWEGGDFKNVFFYVRFPSAEVSLCLLSLRKKRKEKAFESLASQQQLLLFFLKNQKFS